MYCGEEKGTNETLWLPQALCTCTQANPWDNPEGRTHQEPIDVHDHEEQQQNVEEEIVRNVRHRLQAGVAGGVQNLEWEPVEAEPEPGGERPSGRLG